MPGRFPRTKYTRMLTELSADLDGWAAWYETSADGNPIGWAQERFVDKANVLREVRRHIVEAAAVMAGLPR